MNISELEDKSRDELLEMAKEMGISSYTNLKKQDLVKRLLQANAEQQGYNFSRGYPGDYRRGLRLPEAEQPAAQLGRCLCLPVADKAFRAAHGGRGCGPGESAQGRREVFRAGEGGDD